MRPTKHRARLFLAIFLGCFYLSILVQLRAFREAWILLHRRPSLSRTVCVHGFGISERRSASSSPLAFSGPFCYWERAANAPWSSRTADTLMSAHDCTYTPDSVTHV